MKGIFELTWLEKGKANRRRPAQKLELEALLVGSNPSADVCISDRLVAGKSLWLRPGLGGVSIEPIDLFAGAFLNGIPIKGHEILTPGAFLQIGQARLELKSASDGKYALTIDQRYLAAAVERLAKKKTAGEKPAGAKPAAPAVAAMPLPAAAKPPPAADAKPAMPEPKGPGPTPQVGAVPAPAPVVKPLAEPPAAAATPAVPAKPPAAPAPQPPAAAIPPTPAPPAAQPKPAVAAPAVAAKPAAPAEKVVAAEVVRLEPEGPQETLWLRQPRYRRAVQVSTLLAVLCIPAAWLLNDTDALTRGPLSRAHVAAAEAADKKGPKLCSDCHTPFGSDYDPACSRCHEAFVANETSHPFVRSEQEAERSCARCHTEHQGGEQPLWPASSTAALLASDPKTPAPTCLPCHDANRWPPLSKGLSKDVDRPKTENDFVFESFSHAKHVAATPAGLEPLGPKCQQCHQLDLDSAHRPAGADEFKNAVGSKRVGEFKEVGWASCRECHPAPRMEVHGRESNTCLSCHEDRTKKELKLVGLPVGRMRYTFASVQPHAVQSKDCSECHLRGDTKKARPIDAFFRHDDHIPHLATGAVDPAAAADACSSCHPNVNATMKLSELFDDAGKGALHVDESNCITCHGSKPTKIVTPPDTSTGSSGPLRTVNNLPHKVHLVPLGTTPAILVNGCAACHYAPTGSEMAVLPGVNNCTLCHQSHENISCAICHVDRGPPLPRRGSQPIEKSVIDEKVTFKITQSGVERFRHVSAGHKDSDCRVCHLGVEKTGRLKDVPMPTASDKACVECHQTRRFHR